MPKDTAASPADVVLRGCHAREMNADPAAPPTAEIEMTRDPSSCRASSVLATAYLNRTAGFLRPDAK